MYCYSNLDAIYAKGLLSSPLIKLRWVLARVTLSSPAGVIDHFHINCLESLKRI